MPTTSSGHGKTFPNNYDVRYYDNRTRPEQKFSIGEKVLCYTIDEAYEPWHNMHMSPDVTFFAHIVHYSKKTKKYTVKLTDFNWELNGTKRQFNENEMISFEKHGIPLIGHGDI